MTYEKIEQEILKIENFQDYSYKELAKTIRTSPSGIKRALERLGITKIKKKVVSKDLIITDEQEQIIIGSILGDGTVSKHFRCSKTNKQYNSQIRIKHGMKQLNYLKYKKELLGSLALDIYIADGQSGFTNDHLGYQICYMNLTKAKEMNKYRDMWYSTGEKRLNTQEFSKIEALGLAIWFMDDGSWHTSSIKLATMWFTFDELKKMCQILLAKFNLDFSICADRTLYLRRDSLDKFYYLIKPFFFHELEYKIPGRGKLCEFLEQPVVANQKPSVVEIQMKVQRLEEIVLTCNNEDETSTSAKLLIYQQEWF